jgi:hypothetical protein
VIHPGDVIGSGTVGTGCFLELNGSGKLNNPDYQVQWLKEGDVVLKIGNKVSLQPNIMTLGFSKKWSLSRLNTLKNQPLYKLTRMIVVLEQKLLIKLQLLRKEYITFGSLSENSSETFGYYQVLNFLNQHLQYLTYKLFLLN